MSKKKNLAPLFASLFLLTSCSLFSGDGGTIEKVPLEGIVLQASATSVTVESTITFTVTPTPTNANIFNLKSYSADYLEYFVEGTRFSKSKSSVEYEFTSIGNFDVYAKYCTHKQHSDTVGDLVSETITIIVSEIDANLVLHVPQPEERSLNIPQPTDLVSQSWNYTLTASGETKTFTYKAKTANGVSIEKGVFNFRSTYYIDWKVRDSSNNLIKSTYPSTNSLTIDLEIGYTYSITITKSSTSGYLVIEAYAPNGQSTISGYTDISDLMWYEDQRAYYTYKPSVSGYYLLNISYPVFWGVYDNYNNRVSSTQYSSLNSISIKFDTTKTYLIIIAEDSIKGNYSLKIYVPNPVINVTGKQKIYDTMRYTNQQNVYSYRPQVNASHVFACSYNVMWAIYDDFGNVLKETKYSDASSISLTLDVSKTYKILLQQSSKTGEYILKIQG